MFSWIVCVTKYQPIVLLEAMSLFWGLCIVLAVVLVTCIKELFSDEILWHWWFVSFTVATVIILVYEVMTTHSLVSCYQCLTWICYLHLLGRSEWRWGMYIGFYIGLVDYLGWKVWSNSLAGNAECRRPSSWPLPR